MNIKQVSKLGLQIKISHRIREDILKQIHDLGDPWFSLKIIILFPYIVPGVFYEKLWGQD